MAHKLIYCNIISDCKILECPYVGKWLDKVWYTHVYHKHEKRVRKIPMK